MMPSFLCPDVLPVSDVARSLIGELSLNYTCPAADG